VRAVEYEYAVKYLEHLGIEATRKNIRIILAMAPFKECKITPGWEGSNEVPSAFHIYPSLGKKLTTKDQQEMTAKRNMTGAKTARIDKRVLPILQIQRKKEEKKFEVKDGSGIPKLTLEVIRKKYLYPFCIDSKPLLNQ